MLVAGPGSCVAGSSSPGILCSKDEWLLGTPSLDVGKGISPICIWRTYIFALSTDGKVEDGPTLYTSSPNRVTGAESYRLTGADRYSGGEARLAEVRI